MEINRNKNYPANGRTDRERSVLRTARFNETRSKHSRPAMKKRGDRGIMRISIPLRVQA